MGEPELWQPCHKGESDYTGGREVAYATLTSGEIAGHYHSVARDSGSRTWPVLSYGWLVHGKKPAARSISIVVTVFGSVAKRYQDIRPGYELSLADDIKRYHGRQPGTVAEIGAGTGKATRVLLTLGGKLICVEPDPRMAAKLPPEAEVFNGTFEEWVAPQGGVDVLACALAWHWADEATRVGRAVEVLAPGGTLALIAHQYAYVLPEQFAAIDAAFKAFDQAHGKEGIPKRGQFWFYDEIARSGRFERIECRTTHKDHPMSSDEYVGLVGTFSPFLQSSPAEQEELASRLRSTVDGLGGTILLDLRTTIVLATPRSTCARDDALVATTA